MKKFLIVLLVLGLVSPVMAADWNFYGSARVTTFYLTEDFGDFENAIGEDDDAGLIHTLQGNARIGATVKVSDQIGGGFEYGSGPNLRKLYGTYNFGGGELLVGQTYTPTSSYFYSNSVFGDDGDLLNLGQFYLGRKPMIQLKMGGFKIALVQPQATDISGDGIATDVDVELPKVEASYSLKTDAFFMDAFAGYQTYTVDAVEIGGDWDESYDIDAYVVGIGGGAMLGPVTLSAAFNYGINYGVYGAWIRGRYASMGIANPDFDGDELKDTTAMQAMFVANFKLSDTFALEAGVGYANYENDDVWDDDFTTMQYYVNSVVTFAPGFFIVPEIGLFDYDEFDGVDLGSDFYAGLKWQINF